MLKLENLRDGENIKIVLKRHWIVYIMLFIYFLIWIIISITLFVILWFWFLPNIINTVFWLFFSLFLYIEWLNHELDMYVVTNNRIIWVEQISFLNRTVSECNLWQVQEVNSRTKWFFANMINYWTLSIQTAGNITTMKMDFCPNSMQEARKILNIVDEFWENIPDKLRRRWKKLK
jgi:hypothetical protein